MDMDQGLRTSEGFIKKKSSSGCLIIKKKIAPSGGVAPLPRKVFVSNDSRERRNLGISFSGSSEELDKFYNSEGIMGSNMFGRNRKFDDVAFDENVDIYRKRMRKDDIEESSGRGFNENRNSLHFGTGSADDKKARLTVPPLREKFRVPLDKPIRVQGKNGVLKVMINKSKNVNVLRQFYEKYIEDGDRQTGVYTNLSVGSSVYSGLNHCEHARSSFSMGKSEPKLQNSLFLRADTGDLETDGSGFSLKPKSTSIRSSDRRDFNLEIDINKNVPIAPVFSSDPKISENGNSLLKMDKSEIKLQNSSERAKKFKSETENSDSKGVKSEEKTPSAEKAVSVKGKETKVKRGTGTEKQLLREKIRHKLVSSGWTINYRPRKNRDYLDAVYINPMGTAYWSIIKAYEAFKKQVGEEDVPEELLNKLTRQTKKKMEKEMKMKQREEAKSNISRGIAMEEAEDDTENAEKLSFLKKKAEKKPPTNTNSHMIQKKEMKMKLKAMEEAEDDTENDEKLSFLEKKNGSSLKKKAEKKPPTDTNLHMIQKKKTQEVGKCALLVRSSDKSPKSQNNGYVPYMGKRTVLSWLIDSGVVHESEKVQYMNRKQTKTMLRGWISREGIHCGCCSKIVTVSKFEIHAGSKLRQPFQNIFLESGKSLLQCQIEAWNRQDEKKRCGFYDLNIDGDDDGNDDACGLCGDGGDLMCCDGCPSTFHQSCIGVQMLPAGDWHCPNCTCKFCETSSSQRNALLTCRMCERKYHESCKEETDALSPDVDRESASFCGKKCQKVFNSLQKLLEVKHELEAGFSWSLIHRTDINIDTYGSQYGFPQKVECNSKLAVALSVVEECFSPINDRRSGINLIHNILYNRGSNYSRLNHSGFYTAILEKGDEIIAAASIRIHGTQLAEMPFIGTRHIHRRHGMCRLLLRAIESALSSFKVEKLIIPAIGDHMYTWTGVFGFNPLEESHKREMRSLNMFVFPKTEMLQKMLVEQNTIQQHLAAQSGAKSILNIEQQHLMPDSNKLISPPKTEGSCLRAPISNVNASSNSSSDIIPESNVKGLSEDDNNGDKIESLSNSSEDGNGDDVHQEIIEG